MTNMAWPRTPDVAWYDNYIVLLSAGVGVVAGLLYMLITRPYERNDSPHGDATSVTADLPS